MGNIQTEEVAEHIKRLKKRKAAGPDDIPMEVFKASDPGSVEIIANILNIWWETEHINEEYLRATVCLIFKRGNTSLLENYRPIS